MSSQKYTSYVEEQLAKMKAGAESSKKTKVKEKEETLFDEKDGIELDGNTTFKDVMGFDAPSGVNHKGTAYKDEDWSEEMQAWIPPEDKFLDYSPSHEHAETLWIAYNMGDNVYASGPTGSGKSSFYEWWCSKLRIPFIRINGSGDVESDVLLGKMGLKDGETVWHDGPIPIGFKNGAMILIDEATVIPAHIMMSLQWALEEGGKLLLNDKEGDLNDKLVERHERTRIVMADNTRGMGDESGMFSGTNVMNSAMLNRIQTFMHFGYKTVDEECSMLQKKFPALKNATVKKIVQFTNLIRTSYEQGEIDHTLSPRDLSNLVRKALLFRSFGKALTMAWIEKFGDEDQRQTVRGHYQTVFNQTMEA